MNEYMKEQAEKAAYERLRKIAHPDEDHKDADASALRFNPESLEYEHPADGPFVDSLPERFIIDNDKKADWAIRKLKEAQVEHSRLMDIAIAEQADLNKRIEFVKKAYENRTTYLKSLLQGYFMSVEPSKTTKTQSQYALLSGKLVMKKQAPEYVRDEAAMVAWAKDFAPAYVQVEESIAWGELKKATVTQGEQVIYADTGEVVPGITAVERPEVFEVKYE